MAEIEPVGSGVGFPSCFRCIDDQQSGIRIRTSRDTMQARVSPCLHLAFAMQPLGICNRNKNSVLRASTLGICNHKKSSVLRGFAFTLRFGTAHLGIRICQRDPWSAINRGRGRGRGRCRLCVRCRSGWRGCSGCRSCWGRMRGL